MMDKCKAVRENILDEVKKELSELTGISKSLISRYLRGDFEANGRRLYSLCAAETPGRKRRHCVGSFECR